MIIFLYGDDTFRSRLHLKKLIAKFKKERDPGGYNVDVVDCRTAALADVMGRVYASPFLAERRMVILESLISGGSDELVACVAGRVEAGAMPQENVCVFWEGVGTFKKKKLPDLLKKEKYAQEFAALNAQRMPEWVEGQAHERGVTLEEGVAAYIARCVGNSWEAHHVLHQVVSLVWGAQRSVSIQDVAHFIEEKIDDNIFALVDALGSRNKKQALTLLLAQWRQGVDDHYLFAMLARQFRLVASVAAAKAQHERATSNDIARMLGQHPFVVKKTLALVPRYSKQDLVYLCEELVAMDTAAKTGRASMDVLMSAFVSKL